MKIEFEYINKLEKIEIYLIQNHFPFFSVRGEWGKTIVTIQGYGAIVISGPYMIMDKAPVYTGNFAGVKFTFSNIENVKTLIEESFSISNDPDRPKVIRDDYFEQGH